MDGAIDFAVSGLAKIMAEPAQSPLRPETLGLRRTAF